MSAEQLPFYFQKSGRVQGPDLMCAFYFNLGLAILNGFYQWLSVISFYSSFDNQCVLIFSSFNLNLSHYPVAIVYFKCGSNSNADELLLKFSLNLEVTEAGSQVTLSVFNSQQTRNADVAGSLLHSHFTQASSVCSLM